MAAILRYDRTLPMSPISSSGPVSKPMGPSIGDHEHRADHDDGHGRGHESVGQLADGDADDQNMPPWPDVPDGGAKPFPVCDRPALHTPRTRPRVTWAAPTATGEDQKRFEGFFSIHPQRLESEQAVAEITEQLAVHDSPKNRPPGGEHEHLGELGHARRRDPTYRCRT